MSRQSGNVTGPCWQWAAGQFSNGRPKMGSVHAHRAIYTRVFGRKIDGLDLHHRCENPNCVNPWHMEPLTKAEHSAEHGHQVSGHTPDKCPEGHDYDEENTYTWTDPKNGKTERHCRKCRREKLRAKTGKTGRVNKTRYNPEGI